MEKRRVIRVVLIGAGNLATHLANALNNISEISIIQVYSRTRESAESLANTLGTKWTTSLEEIDNSADLIILSIKDDALQGVIKSINITRATYIHTAGSVPMEIFNGSASNYGVLYPLQTFSKAKEVEFSKIPIFIEGSSPEVQDMLSFISKKLSSKVRVASSEQRKYLHLAAVFACNFTNHLFAQAASILNEHGLMFEDIIPLIDESVSKIHTIEPQKAQTGPAVRGDNGVLEMQKSLLNNDIQKEIYTLISNSIQQLKERQ
ncbi:MAG: Rossmann-like and DUF2520 domain-containing protein [Bacteroidales bacterium]